MSSWKIICTTVIIVLAILTIFYAAFFTRWDAKGLHWGLHETPTRHVRCRPTRYQRTPSGGYVTINTCYRRASAELRERHKKEAREHKRREKAHKTKEKELTSRERELEGKEESHYKHFSFWGCIKNAFRKLRWQKHHKEREKRLRKQRQRRAAAHMEPVTPVMIKHPKTTEHGKGSTRGPRSRPAEQIAPPFTARPPGEAPMTRVLVKKKTRSHKQRAPSGRAKGAQRACKTSSTKHRQHPKAHRAASSVGQGDEFEQVLRGRPSPHRGAASGMHHGPQACPHQV